MPNLKLVAGKVEVLVYSTVKARALPITTMVRSPHVDSTAKEVQVYLVHLGFHNGALKRVHVSRAACKPRGLTVDDNQLPQSLEVVGRSSYGAVTRTLVHFSNLDAVRLSKLSFQFKAFTTC